MRKILVLGVLLFGFNIYSGSLLAGWGSDCVGNALFPINRQFVPNNVSIKPGTQDGTILASLKFGRAGSFASVAMNCSGKTYTNVITKYEFTGLTPISGTNYYDVGVPGLGLEIITPDYSGTGLIRERSISEVHAARFRVIWWEYEGIVWGEGVLNLVKIGDVASSGVVALNSTIMLKIPEKTEAISTLTLGSVIVNNVTCSVSVPPQIGLESASKNEFSGIGRPVTKEKTFSIELAGCNPVNMSVALTMEGDPDPTYRDVLRSTAPDIGVGIQVLNKAGGSTPLPLEQDIPVGTTGGAANFSIPLAARYFQLGPVVGNGPVRATASFTVNIR